MSGAVDALELNPCITDLKSAGLCGISFDCSSGRRFASLCTACIRCVSCPIEAKLWLSARACQETL